MPHTDPVKRREYMRAYLQKWRKLDYVKIARKRQRRTSLIRSYGISVQEYQRLLEHQQGVCAVCRQQCKTYEHLSVDHNHATGKVRGLLCAKCNVALGMLNEDRERIAMLLNYLFEANP
jgi:hypothetical protein